MPLFRKDNLRIQRQDPAEIARQGGAAALSLAPTVGSLFQQGVSQAGQAAATAADQSLSLNLSQLPAIREGQREFNQELFGAIEEQERLAGGDIAQRLEQEASERLGTGLTFDEERSLREASRGAFASRGRFRDTGAIFDELQRRTEADTARRLQNAQFAGNVLGLRQGLFQQGIQNRGQLFLDPRSASGITAGSILQAGAGLGQQALGAGVGISQSAAAANQQAQAAEAAANRRGGIGGQILRGIGGAATGFLGSAGGSQLLGGLFGGRGSSAQPSFNTATSFGQSPVFQTGAGTFAPITPFSFGG